MLLDNAAAHGDGVSVVTVAEVEAVAGWQADAEPSQEIAFMPASVLLQDFTGVPAVVDLAALREACRRLGADPRRDGRPSKMARRNGHRPQSAVLGSLA